MSTPENKTVTIDARHDFTDHEKAEILLKASRSDTEYKTAKAEFDSSRGDWKAKLKRIELDRDGYMRKGLDGFEMRPVQAYVFFDDPTPGRKSFYRSRQRSEESQPYYGLDLIRVETMTEPDFQPDLPLEETPKNVPVAGDGSDVCGHGVSLLERCKECDALKIEHGVAENCDKAILRLGQVCGTCGLTYGEHSGDSNPAGGRLCPSRVNGQWDATTFTALYGETGHSAKELEAALQMMELAGQPIGTSIGDLLDQAAQGKRPNPVVIDFAEKDGWSKCLARWRKAATAQGWPIPCIDLIDGIARQAARGTTEKHLSDLPHPKPRVLAVLHAHSISTDEFEQSQMNKADGLPVHAKGCEIGENWRDCPACLATENERLASTFGTSEEGE